MDQVVKLMLMGSAVLLLGGGQLGSEGWQERAEQKVKEVVEERGGENSHAVTYIERLTAPLGGLESTVEDRRLREWLEESITGMAVGFSKGNLGRAEAVSTGNLLAEILTRSKEVLEEGSYEEFRRDTETGIEKLTRFSELAYQRVAERLAQAEWIRLGMRKSSAEIFGLEEEMGENREWGGMRELLAIEAFLRETHQSFIERNTGSISNLVNYLGSQLEDNFWYGIELRSFEKIEEEADDLIERFLPIEEGEVYVDGTNLLMLVWRLTDLQWRRDVAKVAAAKVPGRPGMFDEEVMMIDNNSAVWGQWVPAGPL